MKKNAASAKTAVDARVKQYFDFLKDKGIERSDINAANITTQPKYEYDKSAKKSKIVGYTVEHSGHSEHQIFYKNCLQ
ncbi:MAG: SIMPL domain-containing protein [Candidatus Arsenophonus phytopathogenicus]